jgi:hypothetical protein
MPPQAEHFPAGRRVPNAHRLVFASGSNAPAVPTEGDAQDVPAMVELAERLAGRRVMHVHHSVQAGRGQPPAIRAERQRHDRKATIGQSAEQIPCFHVPKLAFLPTASHRQASPVGAERHRDRMFRIRERCLSVALLPIPDLTTPRFRRTTGRRGIKATAYVGYAP